MKGMVHKTLVLLALAGSTAGCVVSETRPLPQLQAVQATEEVSAERLLDVGIHVFDPGIENVTGYLLYYGTQSRTAGGFTGYAAQVDAGNVTQYAVDLPDPAATYYLAVKAYNGQGLRSDYSAEVTADPTAQGFTIAASAGANGTISPNRSVSVQGVGNQSFSITPSTSYHVADVLVDGQSVGAVTSYAFTNVTANHTIAATFVAQYTITAPAAGSLTGGTVTPAGVTTLDSGGIQTYTITATAGYRIASVTVDGSPVTPTASPMGYLPASIVAPTMLGQSMITALLAVLLLGEALSVWQILGVTIVLAGVYMVHHSQSAPREAWKIGRLAVWKKG